jgi:hypothetical protein
MTITEYHNALDLGKRRSDCSGTCINNLIALIAIQSKLNVAGDIAECGSYKCGATIAMAAAADYYKTDKKVFAFDLWGGLPYGAGMGFENFADSNFEEISKTVLPFRITLIRGKHEDTVPQFKARPISLLFMDSDFYSSHIVCLTHFWPMIPLGGSVAFHDWHFPDVQKAIKEVIPADEHERHELPSNMGMIKRTKLGSSTS